MPAIAKSGEQRLEEEAAAHAQELLFDPKLWRRLLIGLLVTLAALPFVPAVAVTAWLATWLLATGAEQTSQRRGHLVAETAASFALTVLKALAAAALIDRGDGSCRFFAVTLIGVSAINVLFRYYAAPRLLLLNLAPLAAVLLHVCWAIFAAAVAKGDWLRALTPVATLSLYVVLLWPAKERLVQTWLSLVRARVEAQEGRRLAEAANRAKSDFLATISHEIRTPLNGILGMAQALQADSRNRGQGSRIQVIRSCGETLLTILDDILDLAKVEAGRLALETHTFDMEHVTRGAVATFGSLAARKDVGLAFSIAPAAKGTFVGDKVRLRQILYNLVSNAVKFTEHGSVAVAISFADGRLTLEVADSGRGIAPDALERIFDSFVQSDASRTRAAGGAGLGLAICRQLIDLMGGTIRVSSKLGRGSIFTVSLPFERVGEARPPASRPTEEPGAPGRPLRVLAAEDNEVNRLVLAALLSQAGVSPTFVENGLEAVRTWRAEPWDLVLMDIQMPVMDGVEATREIRETERAERRARTPIVAVTANALPQQCAEYAAAGVDGVLTKPLDVGQLFRVLDDVLKAPAEPPAP